MAIPDKMADSSFDTYNYFSSLCNFLEFQRNRIYIDEDVIIVDKVLDYLGLMKLNNKNLKEELKNLMLYIQGKENKYLTSQDTSIQLVTCLIRKDVKTKDVSNQTLRIFWALTNYMFVDCYLIKIENRLRFFTFLADYIHDCPTYYFPMVDIPNDFVQFLLCQNPSYLLYCLNLDLNFIKRKRQDRKFSNINEILSIYSFICGDNNHPLDDSILAVFNKYLDIRFITPQEFKIWNNNLFCKFRTFRKILVKKYNNDFYKYWRNNVNTFGFQKNGSSFQLVFDRN